MRGGGLRGAVLFLFELLVIGTSAQAAGGDAKPTGLHCTRTETEQAMTAFDTLIRCIPTTAGELDVALASQLQTGLVLGSLDLPLINTCLEKIKAEQPMTPAMTDECKHAIAKLGEQGQQSGAAVPPTPASTVAHKLSEDPQALCTCVPAISIADVVCQSFPVVPAVRAISRTCQLLLSDEIQQEITATGHQQRAVQHDTSSSHSKQQEQQPPRQQDGAAGSLTSPLATHQPAKQPAAPQGGASDTAVRCYEAMASACPGVSDEDFNGCAERAIKAKQLEPICAVHLLELKDDHHLDTKDGQPHPPQQQPHDPITGGTVTSASAGKKKHTATEPQPEFGSSSIGKHQHNGGLAAGDRACAALVVKECMEAANQAELNNCVHNLINDKVIPDSCLTYLTSN